MIYVDTSALAKWYFPETGSEPFSDWMQAQERTWISTLTVVEMNSLVLRRVRDSELDHQQADEVLATLTDDVNYGFLLLQPVDDSTVSGAVPILTRLSNHPLRTLDAIHLSVIHDLGASTLATADGVLGQAGRDLGLELAWFGQPPIE